MDRVRFAVVGCGNIGSRHLAVIEAEPEAELAALCDIDQSKVAKYCNLFPGVAGFAGIEDLLREADVDVVTICTPHYLHAEMSVLVARSGRHVLVEKPMALHAADCELMIDAARDGGVNLMVVKQNRYNVPVALLKQALDDGRFGRVLMSQCNVIWNRYPGYYSQSPWLGRKEYEGGALYTQVSHFLDLMIWMFGPLVGASAMTETMMHAIDIEDGGAATLRFENGTIGSLFWTTCAYSRNLEGSILVVGESGIAKVGGTYLNRLEHWNVEGFPVPDTLRFDDRPNSYGKYQGTSSNHDKVIRDVVRLVRGQGGSVVMGDEGRLTVSAIEMIYSSLGRRH